MAEKLSVTTAIIGLLAVGGKTIDALWDLNTPATKAGTIFTVALQEVKQCRSTVHILYKTLCLLESAQLPFPERGTWIEADHLIATLTDTVLAISDLQTICDTLGLQRQGLATPPPEDGFAESEKIIMALCSRIRWHNLSMTMMTTILKCRGESDAQNSRVGLERRMTRLLNGNTKLTARMRELEDVFECRVMDRESLPHYSRNTAASFQPPVSDGLSPFSGYTLADIPVLSIIPIPVLTTELMDGNEFYTFAYARRVSRDLGELMQYEAGQGTSRTLGVILGRTNTNPDVAGSTSSTGSNESSPAQAEPKTKTKKRRFYNFRVRRGLKA